MPLVISSEQEPSWLIVLGLDDTSGQRHGLAQQRLDVLSLDAMLPALDPVAGISIEILPDALQGFEPGGSLRIADKAHSYCIAMSG
jgi:hypothetical protein